MKRFPAQTKPYRLKWIGVFCLSLLAGCGAHRDNPLSSSSNAVRVYLCCDSENDLYRVLDDNNFDCVRFEDIDAAVTQVPQGSSLLILANHYPQKATQVAAQHFDKARRKRLRLYVEYPGWLPGVKVSHPLRLSIERIVVASDFFGPNLRKLRIVSGKGMYPPPASNQDYGGTEASLIQQNGDPVCDLLYTTNFAFLGLNEAFAATGEPVYRKAEDKLARFLCRIQIGSQSHPELDGTWFRAFDFQRWEHWGSDADAGWGAWCAMTGWIHSWITSVMAMRQMNTSLWDLTADVRIAELYGRHRPIMIPQQVLQSLDNERTAKVRETTQ